MKVKIHCFEGEWDRKRPQLSVKPLIELLGHSPGNNISVSYKHCQSIQRLTEDLRIDGRTLSSRAHQQCLYFAFHGNGGGLWGSEGDRLIPFDEIAAILEQKAAGSIIFFGSCGTHATSAALKSLKIKTNARLVVGYGTTVDWFDSSVFEMAFFNELCRYQKLGSFLNKIQKVANQEMFNKLKVRLI